MILMLLFFFKVAAWLVIRLAIAKWAALIYAGIYHNNGCKGGKVVIGLMYVIANHGIDTEKSYPYRSLVS